MAATILVLSRRVSVEEWNASDSPVLRHIPLELQDPSAVQEIRDADIFTKTLGIEWNARGDFFRLTAGPMPRHEVLTKPKLVSDIAKIFDVLGWFSPSIVHMKILMQCTWERRLNWDDPVPQDIYFIWNVGDLNWSYSLPSTFPGTIN